MDNDFRPITVDNLHDDENAILEVVTRIWRKQLPNDLVLLNYYELLPFSYNATVENIAMGQVEVNVHKNQALIMSLQKTTFLRSEHFPHDVRAIVSGVDFQRSQALVCRFFYVTVPAERRRHVRVNMQGRIEATMQFGALTIKGSVYDLSVGGIAINSTDARPVETGTPGIVSFIFNGKSVRVTGRLMRTAEGEGTRRFVVLLEPDGRNEQDIYQVIQHREREIIQKVREMVERQS